MKIVNSIDPAKMIGTANSLSGDRPVSVTKSMVVMLPEREISGTGIITIGGGGCAIPSAVSK